MTQKIPKIDTQPSFPARKTPEYQNQLTQSYVNIPAVNGTNNNGITKVSQVLKTQSPSPGVPLNFAEPPIAASSPIPATSNFTYSVGSHLNGVNGYRNGTSPNASSNASTSFSININPNSSTTNNNNNISNVSLVCVL